MKSNDIAKLATSPIFKTTNISKLSELLQNTRWQEHYFYKRSLILLQGCLYSSLYILVEGKAWAEMTDDEGRCFRIESFSPVEVLALPILFSSKPILPVSVTAQTDCRIFTFPKEDILDLCIKEKNILKACLESTGEKIQFLSERLRLTAFATLRQRIADWIIRRCMNPLNQSVFLEPKVKYPLQTEPQCIVAIEPSVEKFAELMGVARPSLSRELGKMRDQGIIKIEGKKILVTDLKALKTIRKGRVSQKNTHQ